MAKRKFSFSLLLKRSMMVLLTITLAMVIYENKKYLRRAYRFLTHAYYKTNFRPTDFPDNYNVHGIDISHFQDVSNWKKLFAINSDGDTIRFKFVIIKATEGLLVEDDMFDENWEDARDNHFVRGAYHYFLPDRNARLQATNFITSVKLLKGDLPPVVDVEETRGKTREQVIQNLKQFLSIIQEHYGAKPIIYSNINFIEDYLSEDFKAYPFWVAHYYREQIQMDDSLQWLFWQHSDKASLLGINGVADADVFNGTEADFNKILLK
jgi:lysozyme